jgi:hypothetical protein
MGSLLLSTSTCLSQTTSSGGQGDTWATLLPLNLARQETGAARIGETVYVVGGLAGGEIVRRRKRLGAIE